MKCSACNNELPPNCFEGKQISMGRLWIDTICYKCRLAGRKTIEELMNQRHSGGRPRIVLPTKEIKRLHDLGFGCKRIASSLKEQGYQVSPSTICRILKEMHLS